MNATSAVEEKVHRDPGQEAIVLVVGHNGDLNSLCEFLGAADFCAAKGTLGVSTRNMVSLQTPRTATQISL